jgi:hypothetical protein
MTIKIQVSKLIRKFQTEEVAIHDFGPNDGSGRVQNKTREQLQDL